MRAKMRKHHQLRASNEGGFSLVELVVVVAVIGILIALAVPRLASIRKNGQDTAAKTALNASKNTIADVMSDESDYRLLSATGPLLLSGISGDVKFQTGATSDPKTVSYATGAVGAIEDSYVRLASRSKSGACYFIQMSGPNLNNGQTLYHKSANATTCAPSGAPAYDAPASWTNW
jgi:type IV pilus assembly protein PilA